MLPYWARLGHLLAAALRNGEISKNPVEQILEREKKQQSKKDIAELKNALAKRSFRTDEESLLLKMLHLDTGDNAEHLAVVIRFFTGIEANIVSALTWRDIYHIPVVGIDQFRIYRQFDNITAKIHPFDSLSSYRRIPIAPTLKAALDARRNYLIKNLHIEKIHDLQIVAPDPYVIDVTKPQIVPRTINKWSQKAVQRIGIEARTVHGALGKSPDANFLDAVSWNCIGLVVVDEASMVSLEMLAGILNRVRRNCRVVLLGDPNQMLSVGAGNILSDLLTLGVPSICLQQQYRQSTDAAALRQNVVDFPKLNGEHELRWDDSFRLLPADDRAIPDLLCEEAVRRYRAGESIQVLSPVRVKTGFLVQALNMRLQNEVNPLTAEKPAWGKFRDGDRVIVTQNNAYYIICNGDVGVLHIRGEKPHRVATLAVRGTLKTWQIDRGQGEYGIGHDDAPPAAVCARLCADGTQKSGQPVRHRPHAGEHGDYKNAVSQPALHRDLTSGEGGHSRGEPRGAEHRDAVHPVPAQIQARRPDQSAAPWAQRVRRHGEKGAAALSRYRRCRHGPKPPPPAAGEGVQREGAAGIPRSGLPAGRVPMAGGKEPSERR